MDWLKLKPLEPSDIVLIITAFIALLALFLPRFCKWRDNSKQREAIKKTLKQLLESFERDLKRIRDTRNPTAMDDDEVIEFSTTSKSEISHYYDYYRDLLVPNLHLFKIEDVSETIHFFNNYHKNISKVAEASQLTLGTVNNLLDNVQRTFSESS